jgi:hypothetical protein
MTVGLLDEYATPDGAHVLAAAAGVPIVEPVAQDVEALTLQGVSPRLPPYDRNVAGGTASAGIAQYKNQGHFVIFDDASAQTRYARFLKSLASRRPPQIF